MAQNQIALLSNNKYAQIFLEDEDLLKKLNKLLSYREPGSEFSPQARNYGWNGIIYLMNKKHQFPIGLLQIVKGFLDDNKVSFEVLDQRPVVEMFDPLDISKRLVKMKKIPRYYQLNAVKAALDNPRGIIKATTGSGKCSDINSLHITEYGLLNYAELADITGKKILPTEMTSLEMNLSTPLSDMGKDQSSFLYYDGYGPSRKITTNYGFSLTATKDHKIQIINTCGEMVWEKFENLKKDDYAVISFGNKMFGKDDMPLDEAYWYGLLLGDGGFTRKNVITLTNIDEHILKFSRNYIKSIGLNLYEKKDARNRSIYLNICSVGYRKKLFDMGFGYEKSTHKTLPSSIRRLKKKPLSMVIRGLYETDGWIEKVKNGPSICIGLSNKILIDQIHLILLNFGIVASRRLKKTTREDCHILTIYREFIPSFMKQIGLDINGHKFKSLRKVMEDCDNVQQNSNTNLIPNQSYDIKNLLLYYFKIFSKKEFIKKCPIKITTILSWSGNAAWRKPSRNNLILFISWYEKQILHLIDNAEVINIINNIKKLCYNNYYFLPIKKIEETYSDNWDLVVPKTHSFVSQGFINHNTLISALITAAINKPTNIFVIGLDLLSQFHTLFSEVFDEEIGYVGNGVCEIRRINIISLWTAAKALNPKKKIKVADDEDEKEKFNETDSDKIVSAIKTGKLIIFDECHSASTESFKRLYSNLNPEFLYGMSGTPYRMEETDLLIKGLLGEIIFDISASELIDKGFLIKPTIKFFEVPKLYIENKTYATIYKEYVVENPVRNKMIVSSTKKLVEAGYQTLVLFRQIAHGKNLLEMLHAQGVEAEMLSGNDKLEKREKIKERLLSGELKCVVASAVYDIGVDISSLNALVLASPNKSLVRALQRIGRVIRSHPGKTEVRVVDFWDQALYLKNHSKRRYKIYCQEKGFEVHLPKGITA